MDIKNIATRKNIVIAAAVLAVVLGSAAVLVMWKNQPRGIVVAVSNLPDSLNPVLEQNTSGMNAAELVFDGLVNFEVDAQSGSLYPQLALAESIEQNPEDKKTYRVLLREAFWHNGNPVVAEDVKYSFDAYMDEQNASPKKAYLASFIREVRIVNAGTVEIEFINPIPEFRAYPVLTFKIIPSLYQDRKMDTNMRSGENERNFAVAPVGTGPYRLTGWEIGKWVGFEVNGAYFKGVPKATGIVIKKMIDPVIRMNELRKGRINLVLETSPMDRSKVARMSEVDINSYLPYAFYQVAVNLDSFPNVDARKALAMSLDRPSLVPSITDQEVGVVLNPGPFPSDLFMRNIPEYVNDEMPNHLPYDPDEARRLAKSGGIAGQTAILLYPDSMGEFGTRMAEGIVRQMAAIGLEVEAKRTGDQVFRRIVFDEKSYELALVYCDGFDNLYSDLGRWYRTNGDLNVTGVSDKELDALFDEWDREVITANWVDLTLELNERISGIAPAMYLCSLEKDVYTRGIGNVAIATDNPFLSVENWTLRN
ncbi:MAG: Periplasmic dipeptide transport protein precursor [Spirochaetes bacterium ADurb.Bin215]|nr:MAG: Periplasmic dipeptide transport protein precursor [Spirochaetes bacterium ADurb.Bin215]